MQTNDNSTSETVSDSTTASQPKKESSDIAELARITADKRREFGIQSTPEAPPTMGDALEARRKRWASLPVVEPPTPEQVAAREAARLEREREHEWEFLAKIRGVRYSECRLANFKANTDKQQATVKALTDYCEHIVENVRYGRGVVLFGPRGTGKDHLAMAVARAAVMSGSRVIWRNGMDLFGDFRDAMDDDKAASESAMIARLVNPDVLYLSDPLPVVGPMSPHQMNTLFRILDGRYSQCKATICTLNVASGEELSQRMGPQNADRLKDGALAIHCSWESYRKAVQ